MLSIVVVCGLLTYGGVSLFVVVFAVYPFAALYIADIDAIEGRGGNRQVVRRLQGEFPDLALWVDSGIADLDGATDWLSAGLGHLVIGSETQSDLGLVRRLAADGRVALSLDFAFPPKIPQHCIPTSAW